MTVVGFELGRRVVTELGVEPSSLNYSGKVVGWAIDRRCEATLVLDAINKAGESRTTSPQKVIHSDHGANTRRGSSPRTSDAWGFSVRWGPWATATTTEGLKGAFIRSAC